MSPPASSSENSPVKSSVGSPERSPEVSPRKIQGKSPGQPSEGSPQKPPRKATGKSPKKSSGRSSKGWHSDQSSAAPGQLSETQFPSLEPFPAPKKKNERKKKQNSPPSREQSPSSNSELVHQPSGTEQASSNHTFTAPSHGFSIPNSHMLVQYVDSNQTPQFGYYLIPQLQGDFANTASFESEIGTSPEAYDKSQTLNAWREPETTVEQDSNESDITTLTASLTLSADENRTSEQNEAPSTQQVRPGPGTRRNTAIATKRTLPPIREHLVLKPGPSITHDDQGSQVTTSSTEEPSSPTTRSIDSPQIPNCYTRPSSSSISTQSSPGIRAGVLTQKKPEGFFWQLDSHGFPCASSGCDQRCNLWDGTTVICPKCGPYSEIRYCSKNHLLDDVKWHWLYCGQMAFENPCRDNSIPQQVRNGPPLIPCIHQYDTPERHHQAVYFNVCAGEGDYFIFSDWTDLAETGCLDNIALRCPSRVIQTVTFDHAEKDRFRRVLAVCLFCKYLNLNSSLLLPQQEHALTHRALVTVEVVELADYMFRLIRDNLRSKTLWTKELDQALKYQLMQELSVQIQPHITGDRHACEMDWNGHNRRACTDTVCRGEFRRFLGSLGGFGHRRLVDHLEASHWILRAARTTHPEVSQVEARMQGQGFEQVLDEDRRQFCRGTGWDGAGSGCMEIEGVNT